MNNLDKQYTALLQDILDNGVEKKDRTGTGTISVFGRQIRHKMSDGFPLLTTKKMAWKTMVTELLWFLRGDTNIKFLVDNDTSIWNGDCYSNYCNKCEEDKWMKEVDLKMPFPNKSYGLYSKEEFINKIKTDDEFAKKWGELGPIYGAQWRSWYKRKVRLRSDVVGEPLTLPEIFEVKIPIDQIANLINDLKTNPDSRRLMVSAWNVGELDQMVLPPCHYGFQVYTRELSDEERLSWMKQNRSNVVLPMRDPNVEFSTDEFFRPYGVPKRAISLMWNQRSVDTFLGLPFNIASYGLLLEIIAKEVNMVPEELIGNLGDVHLYSNHIEQAKEQIGRDLTLEERIELASKDKHFDPLEFGVGDQSTLEHCHHICDEYGVPRRTRQPYELPTLKIESEVKWNKGDCLPYYSPSDFTIENYQSYPSIKAPLSN